MKLAILPIALPLLAGGTAQAAILYSDDFTTASEFAGAYDAGTEGARDGANWTYATTATGVAAGDTRLQTIDTDYFQQITVGDQWSLKEGNSGSGDGLFFQDITQASRTHFNWATSSYASAITTGGGIQIDMDIVFSDIADNNAWIEFAFGTGNAFSTDNRRYDDADVDFGFRFEGDRIDQKDNNASAGTISFGTPLTNNVWTHATIKLAFSDFDLGSTVNATMTIGANTFANSFTWDSQDDFSFSFGPGAFLDEDFITVDNLVIQTIPEPSAALFGGLGLLGLLRRRRA
ncbi:MAG: hypothetical protein KDN05_09395 [Verrucomicrobiae bacterium]|nr:hypothetical protein [Verrucomicrobiae bacterium]MCP5543952.1 hypothetical protein [Akkermansiaceae bacterium]MCP5547586.1 hypothetical protein [Akkermansiaceae bacterium]